MFVLQVIFGTDLFVLDRSLMWSEPWRIVTSIFAHGGIAHLLLNSFALFLFGLILEQRIGSKRVIILFLVSGVLINLITPYPLSLGASGAIYALIGALALLRPTMMMWGFGVPMPMILVAVLYLIQDIIGAFAPASTVGNLAHISGLIMGVAVGIYWRKKHGDTSPEDHPDALLEKELDGWEREKGLR